MIEKTDFMACEWKKQAVKTGEKLFLSVLRQGIKIRGKEYHAYRMFISRERNRATNKAIDILLGLEDDWKLIDSAKYSQDISDYEIEIKKVLNSEKKPQWGKKYTIKKTKETKT